MDPINEEIKRRADIVEIVSQYVALRPAGNNRFKACCPFHDEKTPSFNVSQDRGFFKCFGCGKSGDVFKFLQEIENIPFPEAKRQLAERYGVALPSTRELSPEQNAAFEERDRLLKVTAAAAAFFRKQFAGNKGLPARDYARERGLSPNTLEKFGIGYAPDSWDSLQRHLGNRYGFKPADGAAAGLLVEKEAEGEKPARVYDRYRHRLIFPIWDPQGRVIAFGGRALEGGNTGTPDAKYINSPEGPLFNKSRTLYAWHLARSEVGKRESVIITEGYMDAIALHEAGFSNTIATLGTSLTTQHVAGLARLAPKTVYLCYDGDSAGMRATLRTAPLFAAHNLTVKIILLPFGDDPDTFIKKNSPAAFEKAIQKAKLLTMYRLEMLMLEFDPSNVMESRETIRSASQVISEIQSVTEQDNYISWLAYRWTESEKSKDPARPVILDRIIRDEVDLILKRVSPRTKDIVETESNYSSENKSGVAKAERMLLSSLLGNPSWRSRILGDLPPARWTEEPHREIAKALLQFDFNAPVDPSSLIETLPPEAGNLVSELLMSQETDTAATDEVITDCVARVENYWARQIEREVLEMMQAKINAGEPISEAERKAYNDALLATKRKNPPAPAPKY